MVPLARPAVAQPIGQTASARVRALGILLLAVGATPAAAGCDSQVPLGTLGSSTPNILWSATFEPGDLSEWESDGGGGLYVENATASPTVTTDQAHGGRYAGKSTMGPTTGSPTVPSSNYFYRNQPSPGQAYYAAWFYIPSTLTVRSWMSLMHFRSSPSGDGTNIVPYWDLNLYPNRDATVLPVGALTTHFYNYLTLVNANQLVVPSVPTDRWVHFEIMIRKATDATGRVTIWQDDVMIIDLQGVATASSDWMQWDAGASSTDLSPATASIYVDDATISLQRLGTAAIPNAHAQP
jgi:hypothetical protein